MTIVLAPDGPLDVEATLARYRLWGEDPANRLGRGVFRRVLRLDGRRGTRRGTVAAPLDDLVPYEVRWHGGTDETRLVIRARGARGRRAADAIVAEVRSIFGLDFDLPAFYRFAKGEPVLGELAGRLYGFRPTLAPTALEMLVGSITAQQVNLAFAFALRARIVRRYGTPVEIGGDTVWAFPEAGMLARAQAREFRRLGFSGRKAEYVRGVARAIADGAIDTATLRSRPSAEVVEHLTGFTGLGRWSAEWFLARHLGRGDVCPAGDLGVRRAFEHYFGRGRGLSEAAIRRRASAWGPYQNLAVHYLLAGRRLGPRAERGA